MRLTGDQNNWKKKFWKLIEHNENLELPRYLPSNLESLKAEHDYSDVPDLETKDTTT